MLPPDHNAPLGLDPLSVTLSEVEPHHVGLLERWLHSIAARPYWRDPAASVNRIHAQREELGHLMIEVQGVAVGYLGWETLERAELDVAGFFWIPARASDMRVIIAEPSYVGRGVATAAVSMATQAIFLQTNSSMLLARIPAANVAARRVFEKAGYSASQAYQEPAYGDTALMTYNRRDSMRPTTKSRPPS